MANRLSPESRPHVSIAIGRGAGGGITDGDSGNGGLVEPARCQMESSPHWTAEAHTQLDGEEGGNAGSWRCQVAPAEAASSAVDNELQEYLSRFDSTGTGCITRQMLTKALQESARCHNVEVPDAEELAERILRDVDPTATGEHLEAEALPAMASRAATWLSNRSSFKGTHNFVSEMSGDHKNPGAHQGMGDHRNIGTQKGRGDHHTSRQLPGLGLTNQVGASQSGRLWREALAKWEEGGWDKARKGAGMQEDGDVAKRCMDEPSLGSNTHNVEAPYENVDNDLRLSGRLSTSGLYEREDEEGQHGAVGGKEETRQRKGDMGTCEDEDMASSHSLDGDSKTLDGHNGGGSWNELARYTCRRWRYYLATKWREALLLSLWMAANAGLFLWRFLAYRHEPEFQIVGYAICISKGAAEVLKLHLALMLLTVARFSATWLRSTPLSSVIPFDQRITFHKIVARCILVATAVHVLPDLGSSFPSIASASHSKFMEHVGAQYENTQPDYQDLLYRSTALTGWLMLLIMAVAYPLAMPSARRWLSQSRIASWLGDFQAFCTSHALFLVFFLLLVVHGTRGPLWAFPTVNTWMYIAVPVALYFLEKAGRVVGARIAIRHATVVKTESHPGEVLSLHLSLPRFHYRSGQYVFLKCPAVSHLEWHPFSITSAPSDDNLTVHIRAAGGWTQAVMKLFQQKALIVSKTNPESDGKVTSGSPPDQTEQAVPDYPLVYIDGPYGTPTQDYENFRVVVLAAAGIGITPMASVIRNLLHKLRIQREARLEVAEEGVGTTGSGRQHAACGMTPGSAPLKTEKAYLYWTTREQTSFAWFQDLLARTAHEDPEGVIEPHNYLTSVPKSEFGNAQALLLRLAQMAKHRATGIDLLSNVHTQTMTHLSRPNWDSVLQSILERHPNTRIGVFCCGPKSLTKELKRLCKQHSLAAKNKATFVFHRESF